MTSATTNTSPNRTSTSPVTIELTSRRAGGAVPLRVDPLNREQLHQALADACATRRPLSMMSVNLHWAALAAEDPEVRRLGASIDLALLDSTPLQWLLQAELARPIEKLAGSDLVPELCAWSASTGYRLFFLGAAPGVADAAAARARVRFPGCNIVGTYAPERAEIEDGAGARSICRRIDATGADVLIVALGMPLQERFIVENAPHLRVPVRFGVGGSLDFLAGVVPRAPELLQAAGLEWAYRVAREPRRLWRRYLMEDLPYGITIARRIARSAVSGAPASPGRRTYVR